MQPFRVALTGDSLDEAGKSAYGDAGLSLLSSKPFVRTHVLMDQAPSANSPDYWRDIYSLIVKPEHIKDVDGLILLRPWIKRSTFEDGAESLVVVGRSGAGYDKVDLAACTENNVAVFNAPLALNHSTASSALMFMLALAKRLFQQNRITRAGRWDLQAATTGSEIEGRTLGIVGLGHSGRELIRLVAPFSMNVLAYSPSADAKAAAALGVRLASLEEVLKESDFVSLHCRLSDKTRQMIGRPELALMKPTAFLINIARGEIVDQAALVEALQSGRIAGAALDVFEVEPIPADDPLLKLDNVIVTPHWSCSTADIWLATGKAMAEGMLCAATGRVPDSVVNPEVLNRPEFIRKLRRFAVNH